MTDERWTDRLIGLSEAAAILSQLSGQKINYNAVYFWTHQNNIPTVKTKRKMSVRERELKAFPLTVTAGYLAELIDRGQGKSVASMV